VTSHTKIRTYNTTYTSTSSTDLIWKIFRCGARAVEFKENI